MLHLCDMVKYHAQSVGAGDVKRQRIAPSLDDTGTDAWTSYGELFCRQMLPLNRLLRTIGED